MLLNLLNEIGLWRVEGSAQHLQNKTMSLKPNKLKFILKPTIERLAINKESDTNQVRVTFDTTTVVVHADMQSSGKAHACWEMSNDIIRY